jgi:hypothetical protein
MYLLRSELPGGVATPYIIIKHTGVLATVCVDAVSFPLTKAGCIAAGRHLYAIGAVRWLCSSSVDHPREVEPWFEWNVSDLLDAGYSEVREAAAMAEASLHQKMVEYHNNGSFKLRLSPDELEIFLSYVEQQKGNAHVNDQ